MVEHGPWPSFHFRLQFFYFLQKFLLVSFAVIMCVIVCKKRTNIATQN